MTVSRLGAHLRYQLARHGWPGAAGLVALVLAGVVMVGVVEPARVQTQALRTSLLEQRQRPAARPGAGDPTAGRLQAFQASLPQAGATLDAVALIHQSAQRNGITLANGEYRLSQERNSQLQRYQITLPARGTYPHLRAWLAEVMNAVPTVALDELSFRREEVGSDGVEARVRLTLFLQVP